MAPCVFIFSRQASIFEMLSGARQFDANDPWASRSEKNAELWVLKKDLSAEDKQELLSLIEDHRQGLPNKTGIP